MQKHILADTSCLIFLDKIKRINWLHELYDELIVPFQVYEEFGAPLPDWIKVKEIQNTAFFHGFLSESLGKGEAASLALALELENPLLILDDQKARKKAHALKLSYTGTSGILLLAKRKGLCEAIKPELDALMAAGMWLAPALYQRILKMAGE